MSHLEVKLAAIGQWHSECEKAQSFSIPEMKLLVPSIILLLLMLVYSSCALKTTAPPTVSTLDKERYAGTWHEIARLPNRFEKDLVAAKAIYGVNSDGIISVRNEGLKKNGETTSIDGTATSTDDPGKLLVRFDRFPANLFAGDYWVLDINDDYTRALIGSPDLKFLWLLSKNPSDNEADFQTQVQKAASLGYDVAQLYYNPKRIRN